MGLLTALMALALFSPGLTAFAAQCGNVRLDSRGGSMEHIPVLDQGELGICYSAAASEMADAYRRSHGDSTPVQSSMIEGAGQVAIGKDGDGNENAFCIFDDGSMVSCGSLTYYGRKNDLK